MTDTPTPGAAAELPVVAWQDTMGGYGKWGTTVALTPHAPAQAQLDSLREEVARLTAALDVARSERDCYIQRLVNERQPTDVDALMALADAWALARIGYIAGGKDCRDAAREALRAKLAARKEEL